MPQAEIFVPLADALAAALRPDVEEGLVVELMESAVVGPSSPRRRTEWRQIAAEVLLWRDRPAAALEQLMRADADGVLVDADWLESCPMLAPLHDAPGFITIRERVRERADEIWKMGRIGLDADSV